MASLDSSLTAEIKTTSDTSGVDKTTNSLKGLGNQSTDTGKHMSTFGDTFKAILSAELLNKAAEGIADITREVVQFGKESVTQFMDAEQGIAQTNAVLASTHGVAGVTADEVDRLSNSWQDLTKYSDDQVRSAENMLLTFTNIHSNVFPQTTQAVLDMSTAMGTDLQSTAIQVGKALQDPVLGATALQRVGVRLTQSQKDTIKSMVDMGNTAGAQKVILQELNNEFGNSAKAAGETTAGKLAILQHAFEDLQKVIGKAIIDAITPLAKALSEFVTSDGFKHWLEDVGKFAKDVLSPAIKWIVDKAIVPLGQAIGNFLGSEGFKQWLMDTGGFISNQFVPTMGGLISGIVNTAVQVYNFLKPALDILFDAISNHLMPALTNLWKNVLVPLAPIIGALLVGALFVFVSALGIAIGVIGDVINILATVVGTIINVIGWFGNLFGAIGRIGSTVINAISGAGNWLYNAGKDIINGLIRGIQDAIGGIGGALGKVGSDIGGTVKNTLHNLHIPGFAQGVQNFTGGLAIVGENGPELVNLPTGSNVYTNQQTSSLLGVGNSTGNAMTSQASGGVNIYGDIHLDSSDAVQSFFKKIDRNNELAQLGLTTVKAGA